MTKLSFENIEAVAGDPRYVMAEAARLSFLEMLNEKPDAIEKQMFLSGVMAGICEALWAGKPAGTTMEELRETWTSFGARYFERYAAYDAGADGSA